MTPGAGTKSTNTRGYTPNLKYCMFAPISPLSPDFKTALALGHSVNLTAIKTSRIRPAVPTDGGCGRGYPIKQPP